MTESQYMTAKTSVWWDIENCKVPEICDVHAIAQNISSALAKINYHGPVKITAYGDSTRIPLPIQHALSCTGISFNHVPAGVNDASDKKILVDMLFWAVDNPAPSNFLLISGDRDFSNALHQLRMRKYNILLAQPYKASVPLVAAAKSVWIWKSLVLGGPPLSDGDLRQLLHNSAEVSNSDTTPPKQSAGSFSQSSFLASQKLGKDAMDKQNLPKQTKKKQTKGNTSQPPKPQNASGSSSGVSIGIQVERNSSNPTSSPASSSSPRNHYPFISVPNTGSLDNSQHPHIIHTSQSSPNLKLGSEGRPKRNSMPSSPSNSCDPSLSSNYCQSPGSAVPWETPDHVPSEIDVVLLALETLKREKMKPHEENIVDCVRYGVLGHKNIDVRRALESAMKLQIIMKLEQVGNLELYVKRKEQMWKCVKWSSGDPNQYDDVVWFKIQEFVASGSGRSALMASRCRFEAGVMLKNTCLEGHALGNVLQILNMIIKLKNWIVPHQSGWQPITILLS